MLLDKICQYRDTHSLNTCKYSSNTYQYSADKEKGSSTKRRVGDEASIYNRSTQINSKYILTDILVSCDKSDASVDKKEQRLQACNTNSTQIETKLPIHM